MIFPAKPVIEFEKLLIYAILRQVLDFIKLTGATIMRTMTTATTLQMSFSDIGHLLSLKQAKAS